MVMSVGMESHFPPIGFFSKMIVQFQIGKYEGYGMEFKRVMIEMY